MKYIILQANKAEDLTKIVNEHLKDGWKLSGGVSVSISSHSIPSHYGSGNLQHSNIIFAQALVQ